MNFSSFISAYWKSFSTEHVLLRLIDDWRNKLDYNNVVGIVLTDFDCIPHDLLVAKLEILRYCSLHKFSYLKNRNNVTMNDTQSYLGDIISGVPQGSVLGSILYNLFFR